MAVTLWPLVNSRIVRGQHALVAVYGPCLGGVIVNPATAVDQSISVVEPLFVDMVNTAVLGETNTCFPIQPGQSFTVPAGFTGVVSVNAASSGHAFSGYVIQEPAAYQPLVGVGDNGQPFPPETLSVLTQPLPAYLYQQYTDDDDLQAWVNAFNEMVSWYVAWFAELNPADYTQQHIGGSLLDWVAAGLYGMMRPTLPLGNFRNIGPFNTYQFNQWPMNVFTSIPPSDYQLTTDDVFRRILTWHIYKDDGDVFNIRWLKRRIERFLTGTDGTGGDTHAMPPWLAPDETYEVSVTFGVGNEVNINFQSVRRRFTGGALFNAFMFNTAAFNEFDSEAVNFPVSPLAPIFKAGVDSGVLELPFQYKFIVNII
jgi:hypothetical protein